MLEVQVLASGSRGNCYYIDDGDTALLIECGIPMKAIQKGIAFKLSQVSGVLLSHEHMDHAKAVKEILARGINVYTSSGTAKALCISGIHVVSLAAGSQSVIGSYRVLAFETQHDAAEPLGFLIWSQTTDERLLFFTDTYYVAYTFEKIDYIIAECNYSKMIMSKNTKEGTLSKWLYERIYRSHMSLETLKDFLAATDTSRLKKIWLVHLSDDNSDAELFKREIQRLTGAEVIVR